VPGPAPSTRNVSAIPLFSTLPANARVLFVRLRSMGDSLLLTSPLHALKSEFPDFRIAVLVEAGFAPCFDRNPDLDEVLTVGRSKLATIRQLFSQRFDAIVNLHGGPTSLAYSLAARGRRVGVEGYQYARLYSLLIPRRSLRQHTVETTMDLFRSLGLKAENAPPLVYAAQPDAAAWVQQNVGDQPYAVIHPAALMSTKRWSPEGFAAVGSRLAANGLKPVLTVGPGEEGVVADTAHHLPDSLILLGLSIPRLAELIRGAALYVGNDSGPMHLAAAVGTPTVAAWGSSDSTRWHPWGVAHTVVQNPFDCNPCPGYRCLVASSPLCIESVTIDQVADAAEALIRQPFSADDSTGGFSNLDHGH
jgi:ADP-heptose:LPS heptosyltransferase